MSLFSSYAQNNSILMLIFSLVFSSIQSNCVRLKFDATWAEYQANSLIKVQVGIPNDVMVIEQKRIQQFTTDKILSSF